MQTWNKDIQGQLNNLHSFPSAEQWMLGDWIDECHVRPEVLDFAALPTTGNEIGDVRATVTDKGWFIWDGAAWQPMAGGGGGVNSVGAVAPIASSGGANPIISHNASGVAAGTYGDASNIPRVTIDAKGHVTSATTLPISVNLPIGSFILGTGPIQTISADTDQITPVAPLHRIQTNGANHTLSSAPQINFPGAVLGQVVIIQNVDPTFAVTLKRGVAELLSLSNSNKKIDAGGTMMLVFNGTLWVEVTHTESTST